MQLKLLYGASTDLESVDEVAGQLIFTTDTKHIYFDKSEEERIELYSGDLTKLQSAIEQLKEYVGEKAVSETVVDEIKKAVTSSQTIEYKPDTQQLEVKLATNEKNILKVDEAGGLVALPDEGTDYSITITASSEAEGVAKRYTIKQPAATGDPKEWTIDIPKDMVVNKADILKVESYDAETYPEDEYPGVDADGIYLHLTIANSQTPNIYVSLNDLVDVYKGAEAADEVKITVDDYTISATLADKGIKSGKIADLAVTSDKLANDAVTQDKIKNGEVTEAKLSADVISKFSALEWQAFPTE